MNKPNFSQIVNSFKRTIANHSPEILMGIGITGMITAGVLAVKGTPKALKLIEDKKKEERVDKLTPVETVKTAWKCYVPAVVTAGVSTACLIGSARVNLRRNAALATAYKLSESALATYREKVIETIGEKKEQQIRDAVAKDKIEKNPVNKNNVLIVDKGNTLCYDGWSGRYFRTDIEKLKKVVNDLNRRMLSENYVMLNEYYDALGMPALYPQGDELGWNIDKGYIELNFSSQLAVDETPCLVVEFDPAPYYGYSRY